MHVYKHTHQSLEGKASFINGAYDSESEWCRWPSCPTTISRAPSSHSYCFWRRWENATDDRRPPLRGDSVRRRCDFLPTSTSLSASLLHHYVSAHVTVSCPHIRLSNTHHIILKVRVIFQINKLRVDHAAWVVTEWTGCVCTKQAKAVKRVLTAPKEFDYVGVFPCVAMKIKW